MNHCALAAKAQRSARDFPMDLSEFFKVSELGGNLGSLYTSSKKATMYSSPLLMLSWMSSYENLFLSLSESLYLLQNILRVPQRQSMILD